MLLLFEKLLSALGYLHLALVFITESLWQHEGLTYQLVFFIFFSFPVSGGKQGCSYFFILETSAGKREETSEDKSSSNVFEDLELFTVMALGVLGKTEAGGPSLSTRWSREIQI